MAHYANTPSKPLSTLVLVPQDEPLITKVINKIVGISPLLEHCHGKKADIIIQVEQANGTMASFGKMLAMAFSGQDNSFSDGSPLATSYTFTMYLPDNKVKEFELSFDRSNEAAVFATITRWLVGCTSALQASARNKWITTEALPAHPWGISYRVINTVDPELHSQQSVAKAIELGLKQYVATAKNSYMAADGPGLEYYRSTADVSIVLACTGSEVTAHYQVDLPHELVSVEVIGEMCMACQVIHDWDGKSNTKRQISGQLMLPSTLKGNYALNDAHLQQPMIAEQIRIAMEVNMEKALQNIVLASYWGMETANLPLFDTISQLRVQVVDISQKRKALGRLTNTVIDGLVDDINGQPNMKAGIEMKNPHILINVSTDENTLVVTAVLPSGVQLLGDKVGFDLKINGDVKTVQSATENAIESGRLFKRFIGKLKKFHGAVQYFGITYPTATETTKTAQA
ncbi:MAG: hypothetical protein H6765_08655 [Candidatus Peribacteria bacterium]|nr:MAG: hypothetical protein H6765_08655 [Candidatus Peribacteria bacterium]